MSLTLLKIARSLRLRKDLAFLYLSKQISPCTRQALQVMNRFQLLRAVHVSIKYRYVYLDNPKTGCSSIKYGCAELSFRNTSRKIDESNRRALLHGLYEFPLKRLTSLPGLAPLEFLIANDYKFVTFVRNPYDRLLSCYFNKIKDESSSQGFLKNIPGISKEASFDQFVRAVVAQSDFQMDSHWKPQTSQILFNLLPYAFIGKFEDFDGDYQRFFEAIGFSGSNIPALQHLNKSANSKIVSLTDFYDSELQAIVYERYKPDFINFGYAYELPEANT